MYFLLRLSLYLFPLLVVVFTYMRQKDALIKSVTEKALGGLGGLGGSLGGDLPIGTPDLVPPVPQASVGGGSMGLPVPETLSKSRGSLWKKLI